MWRPPPPVLGKGAPDSAELLALMGLSDLKEKPAGSLSYAHQRRLAIARALGLRPRFLLLDEPAAGMTPGEVAELERALLVLRDRTGLALLLVEHNMSLVMSVCERLVVMDGGQLWYARGTPEVIRQDPLVRQAYLGHGRERARP